MAVRAERALLFAAAAAFATLVLLALAALDATGRVDGLDGAVLAWVRDRTGDRGAGVTLARDITALGNDATLWVVSLLAAGWLAASRRWRACGQLVVAAGTGGLLTSAIKAIVDRPRPSVVARLVEVHSASFPSGHAMNSAFVYGTLALLACGGAASVRERRYLLGAALALSGAIGASRVVLGVHWPSDVLAGWAIGLGWTVLASSLARRAGGRGIDHDRPIAQALRQ